MSGNQHILSIINHLTGWLKAFPISDKKDDTIVHVFINNDLPVHMCLMYILSHNGTEYKNQFMDNIVQLGIDCIFSAPYHPQSNGTLEVFHEYLKLMLRKLCQNDQDEPGPISEPGTNQLSHYTTPCHSKNTFFPCLQKGP